MESSRKYGSPPYRVALIHGGPGIPGSLAPVAQKLSETFGVLEILNRATGIAEQEYELYEEILRCCDLPVVLIGHSYGAWLVWMFTAKYPNLVKKIILLGAAPFEVKYADEIFKTRLNRLSETEQERLLALMKQLQNPLIVDGNNLLRKAALLITKADHFSPVSEKEHIIEYQHEVFTKVWGEAENLRKTKGLLHLSEKINCPVFAIHGNYDPHPFQGVFEPLSSRLKNFKMKILDKCGHNPWNEEFAFGEFYSVLLSETQDYG